MSGHRILYDMFKAGYLGVDPGDAKTLHVTHDRQMFPIVTATAETRTLAQPTKAGLMCSVVLKTDGGDLTLTVTGGYNPDGDTSITFADAGDCVTFQSIQVGTSYYWDVLSHRGTNVSVEDINVDQLTVTHSTDTVGNIQPFQVITTLTGAGATAGRGLFQLNANAALGGWANALKGYTKIGASGKIAGVGSGVCAELEMSAGCADGTYAPMEVELVMPENAKIGTATSLIHCAVSGNSTAVGLFDHGGAILRIDGVSIDTGHAIAASAKDGVKSTHSLRISINGTPYYIPLSTGQDFNT